LPSTVTNAFVALAVGTGVQTKEDQSSIKKENNNKKSLIYIEEGTPEERYLLSCRNPVVRLLTGV